MNNVVARILFLCMCMFGAISANALSAQETFSVACDEDNIPVCYRDEAGEIVGVDVDIVRELCKRMGLVLEIRLVPWNRVLLQIKEGQVEAGMSLFLTPERLQYSLYPDVPVHEVVMAVFTATDSDLTYTDLTDLHGRTVGIRRGFSISPEFDEAVKEGRIETRQVGSVQQLIEMVQRGRIDAFVDTRATVGFYLKQRGTTLRALGPIGQAQSAFLVISKAAKVKNVKALFAKVNKTLQVMKQEGVIEAITKRYLQYPSQELRSF